MSGVNIVVGNIYRDIQLRDNVRAHLGNTHHNDLPGSGSMLAKFKVSDYEGQKNRNPDRDAGTCKWFLCNPIFERWLRSTSDDLLWLSADPECGKSVLSRSLIDLELRTTEESTTCYFFFKDNGEESRLTTALCALLHQLFRRSPVLSFLADNAYHVNGDRLMQENLLLWQLLLAATDDAQSKDTICVIDALDECERQDQYQLITLLDEFYHRRPLRKHKSKLRFLVTSRPYRYFEYRFHNIVKEFPEVRLAGEHESKKIAEEIEMVIRHQLPQIAIKHDWKPGIAEKVLDKILKSPSQTYLWVRLILDEIEKTFFGTPKKLLALIATLPESADAAYEKILSKCEHPKEARVILSAIVAALRPLTIQEVDVILALTEVEFDESTGFVTASYEDLDLEDDVQQLEARLRHICGLFVIVQNGKIHLIHQTAKEFLLSHQSSQDETDTSKPSGPQWKHSLNALDCELSLALSCVKYLGMLDRGIDDDVRGWLCGLRKGLWHITTLMRRRLPFLQYSAEHWIHHAQKSRLGRGNALLCATVCDGKTNGYLAWSKAASIRNCRSVWGCRDLTRAEIVTLTGLEAVVHVLWEAFFKINQQNENGNTVLMVATMEGHASIVRLLLEAGANPNIFNYDHQTALSEAVVKGDLAIARLLLEYKAAINAKTGSDGLTALHLASILGNVKMSQFLLQHGAAVNKYTEWDENIALRFLRRKTTFTYPSSVNGVTALHLASDLCHLGVVEVLLQNEASIEQRTTTGQQTALQLAASRGHTDIIHLLLRGGADVNACKAPGHWTALEEAVVAKEHSAVSLLLKSGAKIDTGNVMMKVISSGDMWMTRILINHALEMEARILQTSASLHFVRKEGLYSLLKEALDRCVGLPRAIMAYVYMILLLVSIGAKVASVRENRPLLAIMLEEAIASDSCIKVIKLMLEKWDDLDLSAEDLIIWRMAWIWRDEDILLLMIKRGLPFEATAQSMATDLDTLLLKASHRGWPRMVELLWNNGAHLDIRRDFGTYAQPITPLFAAATQGHVTVVQWLVEHGADVDVRIENHGTVLQAMIGWLKLDKVNRDSGESILQALIRAEANIHIINDLTTFTVLKLLRENESLAQADEARGKQILAWIPGPDVPDVPKSVLRNMQLELAISRGDLVGFDPIVEETGSHYWSADVDNYADEHYEDWEEFQKAVNGDDDEEDDDEEDKTFGHKIDAENDDDTS